MTMFFKKSKRMTLVKLFQIESCVDSENGRLLAAPVARHFLLPSPKRKRVFSMRHDSSNSFSELKKKIGVLIIKVARKFIHFQCVAWPFSLCSVCCCLLLFLN